MCTTCTFERNKMLLRKIKDLNKWGLYHVHGLEDWILLFVISSQIESMEPESKPQHAIFVEIDKLQFIWKCKGPSQNYFGKEKVEGLTQLFLRLTMKVQ